MNSANRDCSENALLDHARRKHREMFQRKCFAERWEPVSKELFWVLWGKRDADAHSRILPQYCYGIFDLYQRTIFGVLPNIADTVRCRDQAALAACRTVAEAKRVAAVDWEKFGRFFGVIVRGKRFFELEAEGELKSEGLLDLDAEKIKDLEAWFCSERWLREKEVELRSSVSGESVSEILMGAVGKLDANLQATLEKWPEWAYQWEPGALAQFSEGMAKGMSGLMRDDGELDGEKRLKVPETYYFLLLAWPEIREMIESEPPKRMEDLWNWLAPFSYASWIEIQEFEQLVSLCRPIGLRLIGPGAPRKPRKT